MGASYYFWKIWLWINQSEKESTTKQSAELSTQEIVKSHKDIAERLIKEGVEISYGKLTYIIDQYDRTVRDLICEGYTVKTNNVLFTPELSEDWSIDSLEFDSTKYKCSAQCTLSPEMQRAMGFIEVKVLGFKNTPLQTSQAADNIIEEVDDMVNSNSTNKKGGSDK
ncbi:DNA-binding domain-containing protein [Bacteroides sp.]|uniref:DNA-binding domain-containing protein n=1 Tax=Bacteroides sp. TaxID=29523 RepID=UPI0026362148|nr:DNA-binding domain-containing protein [Bacteroides sp.]